MYLRNTWYVAAWSSELGAEPLARTICEQPILLYRSTQGVPVALANMCPHRFAPLNRGVRDGDEITCGYHGMRFGADGRCTNNPQHDGTIAPKMRVRAYPAVERYDMVWLWFGEVAQADASAIPYFSFHVDPKFRRIGGMFEVNANYELITDNVLDLTHGEFVHPGILSSKATTRSKLKTHQQGTTVWANRWIPDGDAAPAWRAAFNNYDENVDQWGYVRWDAPAHLVLDIGVTPVGRSRAEGIWLYGTDIITPKDGKSSYYFWAFSRNYAIDDPTVDEMWSAAIDIAFAEQDKPMIEAQQALLGDCDLMELAPIMVSSDVASTRVRRLLRKMIADERAGTFKQEVAGEPPLELLARRERSSLPVEPAV